MTFQRNSKARLYFPKSIIDPIQPTLWETTRSQSSIITKCRVQNKNVLEKKKFKTEFLTTLYKGELKIRKYKSQDFQVFIHQNLQVLY